MKSMPCRLQELQNLLSGIETPCSEINGVWSSIFQDLVLPTFNWEALWILSEESCIQYNLIHPTAVIVGVKSYDWDNLAAVVTVKAVQDDIALPSVLDVPLVELHPIKAQEVEEHNLKIMADWLDKCRYFFKYLWYPWDAKINVSLNEWCESHLENRLQIQWDIQNGLYDKYVIRYYKSLIAESRKIECELTELGSQNLTKGQRTEIINKCIQRKVLKMELEFFEDPDLRSDLVLLKQKNKDITCPSDTKEIAFVWAGGNIDSLMMYLNSFKSDIGGSENIKVSSSLQEALNKSVSWNIIVLTPGEHMLKSVMGLGSGCCIKGLCDGTGDAKDIIVVADNSWIRRAILFECFGDLQLENLTISREEGITIQVFENTLKVSRCRVISEKSSVTKGIIVLPGCTLVVEDCELSGFGVGVSVQKGGKASICNTRIYDCVGGLKLSEGTDITLRDVQITNCSEYAIRLEISGSKSALPMKGDLALLSDFSGENFHFHSHSVELCDNKNCNVIIEGANANIMSESFDEDISNDTILISDEETSDNSMG